MLKVSDAFNSAFAAPDRELRARVTIGKTVYDSDDLTSINYDSGAMTGEQFSIGSTYMNSAKIIFSHLVEGLKQLDEVLVELGVLKPDGTVEYVKMGTFIVDDKIQMDRNNNTTTIECMDRMTMLGGTYVSKLTYPARIKDVAIEIANMAGVKANETSFARLSENKINQPTGYTYRDAIGLIAQFQMGFALFDRDGLLDIRTLQDNSFKIDPNQYFLKGLVKNETFFKLNGISCTVVTTSKDENGNETSKTTVLQSGSSSGAQIKLANNVMTQDVLDRMYEALKFTNYYPFSLNWNGNPAVEAGDWLTVEDLQGNEFKVPNMSYTLTYNGGLTTTSKADTSVSSPATYSYGGSMSNIVNEIGGREGAEGNHIYEGTEDQKPLFPKEGDLWYKHVGPDTEERIYKDGKWEFLTSTKTANDAADAADKASKEAEEAKKQANKAVDGANDAVSKAGFANDTADQAKSDAATALQKVLDAYTHGDQIKTGLTADIDAVKGQVSLKASQSDVDKLGGRVTSAEAQIKLQADQIALTVSKTELTNVLTSYATQTWTQGQIKTTADQIKLSVSQVQTNLDNLQIGSRNYVINSDFSNGINAWWVVDNVWHVDQQATLDGVHVVIGNTTTPYTGGAKNGIYQTMPALPDNISVAVSFYAKASKDGAVLQSEPYGSVDAKDFTLTTEWKRYSYFGSIKDTKTVYWMMKTVGVNYWLAKPQVEVGNKVTDYHMATEDYATEVQYSQLQLTVNGIQGTVQNKADQSQVTQLAGQITSVVGGMGQKNLITNTEFNDLSEWEFERPELWRLGTNQYDGYKGSNTLFFNGASNTSWTSARSNAIPVGEGEAISASAILFATGSIDVATPTGIVQIEADFYDTIDGPRQEVYGKKFNNTDPYAKQLLKLDNIKVPASRKFVRFAVYIQAGAQIAIAHPMLVKDTFAGKYQPNTVSESQITQLQSDVNLRVRKGDVINQINISPEGVLIAGQKVHITGQTSIDNAVIKDAMIANVKADKITAGTLNAANVNVINLNANNITTGTIRGANLSMNLNTGEVVFQHGRIHSASNNVDVNIDQGYLSVANGNTRVLLKNGGIQFVQPTIFDERTNPYLSISNGGSGLAFSGARIVGRDYVVMANNANSSNIFDSPLGGAESFAGISAGYDGTSWHPTKIGGAERGIILSAGKKLSSDISWVGGSASICIGSDGSQGWNSNRIELLGEYVHSLPTYVRTASGSANVIVAKDGALLRSTSASKYKTDIIRSNIPDYGDKLLELPTATWMDIAETKRYRDDPVNQVKPTRNFGMIAEDLADAGLEMLVVRGADGELEGINYDRIGPALIPVIAKLKNEVEILKQKLEEKTA